MQAVKSYIQQNKADILKNFFCICFLIILLSGQNICYAAGYGYKYLDGGAFFTNVTMPNDMVKKVNYTQVQSEDTPKVYTEPPRITPNVLTQNLKKGKSSRINVFGMAEWGNSGVYEACRKGHIKKIHYVETSREKVYIPFFVPIHYIQTITTVYGE